MPLRRARYGTTVIARGAVVAAIGVTILLVELWVAGSSVTVLGWSSR